MESNPIWWRYRTFTHELYKHLHCWSWTHYIIELVYICIQIFCHPYTNRLFSAIFCSCCPQFSWWELSSFLSLLFNFLHFLSGCFPPPRANYQPAVLSILILQPIHPPILPTYSPHPSAYLPELMRRRVRAVSQLIIGVELYGFIKIYNFRLILLHSYYILIYFAETHSNCS